MVEFRANIKEEVVNNLIAVMDTMDGFKIGFGITATDHFLGTITVDNKEHREVYYDINGSMEDIENITIETMDSEGDERVHNNENQEEIIKDLVVKAYRIAVDTLDKIEEVDSRYKFSLTKTQYQDAIEKDLEEKL